MRRHTRYNHTASEHLKKLINSVRYEDRAYSKKNIDLQAVEIVPPKP
jgi:hypothetical protein